MEEGGSYWKSIWRSGTSRAVIGAVILALALGWVIVELWERYLDTFIAP